MTCLARRDTAVTGQKPLTLSSLPITFTVYKNHPPYIWPECSVRLPSELKMADCPEESSATFSCRLNLVSEMSALLSLLAATLVLVANVYSQDLTVELDQGIIQGSVGSTVSGVTFYSFLGIPYAQPPVGELRFKAPQEAPSWEGVRDASTVGSNCVQVEGSVEGSEDCLFINVYTPQLPGVKDACSLLPVMVWIHGGGLISGSGDPSLYGPGYLLDREIVFVTFNYRLGALGTVLVTFNYLLGALGTVLVTFNYRLGALGTVLFTFNYLFGALGTVLVTFNYLFGALGTVLVTFNYLLGVLGTVLITFNYLFGALGNILVTFNYLFGALGFLGLSHSEVSLNNGLKDQRAALRWVQQNIERFGGDPARTTIFGESSGAASVEYFMLSPSTSVNFIPCCVFTGLFQRAISQSGSVLNPWAYVDTTSAQIRARQLTRLLGYTAEDNDDIYNFLMGASAENITLQQSNVTTERRASESLAFVPTVERETGSGGEVFLPATPLEILKSGNFTRVPYITGFCSAEGKATIPPNTWDQVNNDFEGFLPYDLNLTIGTTESQHAAALVKKTYFGNETASIANVEQYIKLLTDTIILEGVLRMVNFRLRYNSAPIYVYQFSYEGRLRAAHADDLGYLFTTRFDHEELESNSTELTTIDRLATLWTNFAKSRDLGEGLDLPWDPVEESKQTYLDINTDLSVHNLLELHPERRAIWGALYSDVDN
uniref:Carboxylesterase type B domain-containing protein n=1 Tax=Timema tahoe TaxID=61484 RepID=A0A7R9NV25_9NEOP|nr:unnamed protein product [Timema tahoe]